MPNFGRPRSHQASVFIAMAIVGSFLLATFDGGVNRGTASIQVLSSGARFTITDRNTLNDTCACGTTHNGVGGPR